MKFRNLGNTGIALSSVILGCWQMGGDYFGGQEDATSQSCIQTALEHGVTTFDTAYIYGSGHSEEVLGAALAGHRQDCVIISKLWKSFLKKEEAMAECERALRRLQTDYMDIYFIHYPDERVPIGETMEALNRMKEQGKIRAIGLSNFSLAQMKEAMQYGQIDLIQPCYNLLWRYIDRDILPFCREKGIGIIPYSPLAQGMLTGKVGMDTVYEDGRNHAPIFFPEWREGALAVVDALLPLAQKYGRSPAQVALQWILEVQGMTAVIAGGTKASHVADNIGAVDFSLTAQEFAALDEISRKFTDQLPHYNTFFDATIVE